MHRQIPLIVFLLLAGCAAARTPVPSPRTDAQLLALKRRASGELVNVFFFLGQKRETREALLLDHRRSKDVVDICEAIGQVGPSVPSPEDAQASEAIAERVRLFRRDLEKLEEELK